MRWRGGVVCFVEFGAPSAAVLVVVQRSPAEGSEVEAEQLLVGPGGQIGFEHDQTVRPAIITIKPARRATSARRY